MKMTKTAERALRGSIRKWDSIAKGSGVDRGSQNCALCQEYLYRATDCSGCPVAAKTGQQHCEGTPYEQWCRERSGRVYHYAEDGDYMKTGYAIGDEDSRKIAEAEVKFLKSLLPRKRNTKTRNPKARKAK